MAEPKWEIAFFRTQLKRVPAREWLDQIPKTPRLELLKIVVAVRDSPPPAFPTSTPMWAVMRGEMKGIYEARDKHDKRLYRLFCLLDRRAPDFGLTNPALVLLCGADKAIETGVEPARYAEVAAFRDEYLGSDPRQILAPSGLARWLQFGS